jgi:type IV secretory pathway TrbL component
MVDTMKANRPVLLLLAVAFVLYSSGALAELGYVDPATQRGILDQVAAQFFERAKSWHGMMLDAALWLFWCLGRYHQSGLDRRNAHDNLSRP